MKTAGLIGGIGPESTVQYYRQIVDAYRARTQDGSYPPVIINSIDMTRMLALIGANQLTDVTAFLLREVKKLSEAGAAFGALASNTPHVVFNALEKQSPIPLISIVDTAARAAQSMGLRQVGVFGTRFTMQGSFYPETFAARGVDVVVPTPDEQSFIHDKYMGELVMGILRSETRDLLLSIAERMRVENGIDALVLGGTELPLILRAEDYPALPMLDTTQLHVARIITEMIGS